METGLLQQVSVPHEHLFLGVHWLTNRLINIDRQMGNIFWNWFVWIRHEDDFSFVIFANCETWKLIDIWWEWISELRQSNMLVVVILTSYQYEILLQQVSSQLILWQHSINCISYNTFRVCLSDILVSKCLKTTRVPSMMSIELLLHFATSH